MANAFINENDGTRVVVIQNKIYASLRLTVRSTPPTRRGSLDAEAVDNDVGSSPCGMSGGEWSAAPHAYSNNASVQRGGGVYVLLLLLFLQPIRILGCG